LGQLRGALGVFGWLLAVGCGTSVGGNRLANATGVKAVPVFA
jgi:hypothetical protein